jgi:hypothetical protein
MNITNLKLRIMELEYRIRLMEARDPVGNMHIIAALRRDIRRLEAANA